MNSLVAYPFTKSNRDRDKVMSEIQLARLHLAMVDGHESVIISTYDGTHPKELLLHGYYFILSESFSLNATNIYIYLEQDVFDSPNLDTGVYFPELLQSIGTSSYEEHECVFSTNASNSSALRAALGLTKQNDGSLVTTGGAPVLKVGGSISNFIKLDSLYDVYYLADEPDNSRKKQIWIKTQTTESGIKILNPYIYFEGSDQWLPLGAVYKEN